MLGLKHLLDKTIRFLECVRNFSIQFLIAIFNRFLIAWSIADIINILQSFTNLRSS